MTTIILFILAVLYVLFPNDILGQLNTITQLFVGVFGLIGVIVTKELYTTRLTPVLMLIAIITNVLLYNTDLFWAFIGSLLVTISFCFMFKSD